MKIFGGIIVGVILTVVVVCVLGNMEKTKVTEHKVLGITVCETEQKVTVLDEIIEDIKLIFQSED